MLGGVACVFSAVIVRTVLTVRIVHIICTGRTIRSICTAGTNGIHLPGCMRRTNCTRRCGLGSRLMDRTIAVRSSRARSHTLKSIEG